MLSSRRLKLERLRKAIQLDIDALPDRPVSPGLAPVVDDDVSGGVLLSGLTLENVPPQPTILSKQPLANPPMKARLIPAVPTTSTVAPPNPDRRFVLVEGAASFYNPGPMVTATALPANDLQRGDLAPAHYHFSPIHALAKYPYKFCNQIHMQPIASAFIDKGKFWEREWDLYYIYDVDSEVPVILVHETQFQNLINEINKKLKLVLRITDEQREEGLVTRFPDHPACRPRYLGRSNSRDEFNDMVNDPPGNQFLASGECHCSPPDSATLGIFQQLMADLADIQKTKIKIKKEAKHVENMGKQLSVITQFKRAQRYLGLRPSEGMVFSGDPQAIEIDLSPPFPFDQDVVFLCVDVEAYERDHSRITEVGVATLDTRDLVGVAPGTNGEGWREKIKARHFRINENKHLTNHEFCAGHPDGFEFGASTFVSLAEAPRHVEAIFYPPFGVHTTNTPEEKIRKMLPGLQRQEKRNIVFLGHDTLGDVKHLQKLGYDPLKHPNIVETMDTAKIYQAWRRELQPTSLGKILLDFDIIGWKLHNAGNDAVYTVQVLLATCVREATIRSSS